MLDLYLSRYCYQLWLYLFHYRLVLRFHLHLFVQFSNKVVARYYLFQIGPSYLLDFLQSNILHHHHHIDFHSQTCKLFLLLYLLRLMKNLFLLILWNNGLILFHFQMLFHQNISNTLYLFG